MYRLFLDDERHPVDADRYIIARSSDEAFRLVVERGIPVEICFDHDLGGDDTSMRFIYAMCSHMQDHGLTLPEDFAF